MWLRLFLCPPMPRRPLSPLQKFSRSVRYYASAFAHLCYHEPNRFRLVSWVQIGWMVLGVVGFFGLVVVGMM